MRLRSYSGPDEAFDGLTAEEIRRIRGAADACVTPGLEGLAKLAGVGDRGSTTPRESSAPAPTKNKRGRRA